MGFGLKINPDMLGQTLLYVLGVVAHTFNSSACEAVAGRSL